MRIVRKIIRFFKFQPKSALTLIDLFQIFHKQGFLKLKKMRKMCYKSTCYHLGNFYLTIWKPKSEGKYVMNKINYWNLPD
jgi:hypothetical protein